MHWLFLLFAAGAFFFALHTPSQGLMVLALVASLGLCAAWIRGRYLEKFGGPQQDLATSIDPAELLRMRQQAEARRAAVDGTSPDSTREGNN